MSRGPSGRLFLLLLCHVGNKGNERTNERGLVRILRVVRGHKKKERAKLHIYVVTSRAFPSTNQTLIARASLGVCGALLMLSIFRWGVLASTTENDTRGRATKRDPPPPLAPVFSPLASSLKKTLTSFRTCPSRGDPIPAVDENAKERNGARQAGRNMHEWKEKQ